jgi:amidase
MCGTQKCHALIEGFLAMAAGPKTGAQAQMLWVQTDMYRSAMLSFLKNYDVVLSPACALPAVVHGASQSPACFPAFSYTFAYNLTGWPGAVVRCGTSTEGLPINVQSVARPWREDVALAVARHLESALGGYQAPNQAAAA